MKPLLLLTLLAAAATALDIAADRKPRRHETRKTDPPQRHTGKNVRVAAARRPAGAPAGYTVSTDKPSVKRAKANLAAVPSDLLDSKRRRRSSSSLHARQSGATYYECPAGNPPPTQSDCQAITDNVYNTNQTLVVTQNACLVFKYQTCKGYFCSLCTDIDTTTDFIGNQLNNAEVLCLNDGYDASLVGEDNPQWDTGFVSSGEGLPSYDVCS